MADFLPEAVRQEQGGSLGEQLWSDCLGVGELNSPCAERALEAIAGRAPGAGTGPRRARWPAHTCSL